MGHWPLATGDSLVVPSRAQVNLPGPCDRSFQTTPLTMSRARGLSPTRHRARGLRVTLAWEPATARGSSRGADRLPTLAALKSTGGVPVRTERNCNSVEPTHGEKLAAAGAFPLYPFIYFPIRRTGPS